MAQAKLFGNLRYDEHDHGWALEVGLFLGAWMTAYSLARSIDPKGDPASRDRASSYKSAIINRLRAHQISVEIPDYDNYSDGSIQATEEMIVERIRNTHSPQHCAFALIGEAGSAVEGLDGFDAQTFLVMKRRAFFAIVKLQQYCNAFFPDGIAQEAIFEQLRRTNGDPAKIRDLLLNLRKPMVILLVLADPMDGGRLRLLREQQRLKDSLAQSLHRDRFEIQVLAEARLDNFGPMLARAKPTIIHFSGHGSKNGIFFSDLNGQATRIEPDRLSRVLSLAGQNNLQGVFLNACFTAEMFQATQGLDQQAVVMEGELSDDAAVSFAQQFYAYLGDGLSFQDAFKWAEASTDLTATEGLRVAFIESGAAKAVSGSNQSVSTV